METRRDMQHAGGTQGWGALDRGTAEVWCRVGGSAVRRACRITLPIPHLRVYF